MSLTVNDILKKIHDTGKVNTTKFLFEHAKSLKLPLADQRSFTKCIDTIEKNTEA